MKSRNVKVKYPHTKLIICEYCGEYAVQKSSNQKYCDINDKPCRYYAALERNAKWKREQYTDKKQLLGSSNLGEHRNKDFEEEKRRVRKERRRLRI